MKRYLFFFIVLYHLSLLKGIVQEMSTAQMFFCMAASDRYFNELVNLIGSIHRVNFNEIAEIAVFNIGLSDEHINYLNSIQKLRVYQVEQVNSYIFTDFYSRPGQLKPIKGWYSWKPVVIKQALDMFPYVFYIDAGTIVFQKLDVIFKYIQDNGYLAFNEWHDIERTTTQYVKDKLDLNSLGRKWILDPTVQSIRSGALGISRKLYNDYVFPMYALSKDIKYFEDDGSAPGGFGWARHDQTLFSIFARLLNLTTVDSLFSIDGQKFYIAGGSKAIFNENGELIENMIFAHTRKKINWDRYKHYIHYKGSL